MDIPSCELLSVHTFDEIHFLCFAKLCNGESFYNIHKSIGVIKICHKFIRSMLLHAWAQI